MAMGRRTTVATIFGAGDFRRPRNRPVTDDSRISR